MTLFPVGDVESDNIQTWNITFNEQSWLLYALTGALALMGTEANWFQVGDGKPEFAADLSRLMLLSLTPGVSMIGVCLPFAGSTANIPSNGLYCDGSSVARADYPDLFATIGTNWGAVDGAHFNLPDMRYQVPIGAGARTGYPALALAAQIGEKDHTLTTAEMPSHSHAINNFLDTGTAVPPPLDAGTEVPHITSFTGSAGGDGAHNNIQPSTALNYYIVATT